MIGQLLVTRREKGESLSSGAWSKSRVIRPRVDSAGSRCKSRSPRGVLPRSLEWSVREGW